MAAAYLKKKVQLVGTSGNYVELLGIIWYPDSGDGELRVRRRIFLPPLDPLTGYGGVTKRNSVTT